MSVPSSYRDTSVHWGKSQANILRLLARFGVVDVRFTMLDSRGEVICEFNYPTKLEGKDVVVGVRIKVPLPPAGRLKDTERLKNQAHRALFYYLKTKFEALQFGLVEFIQEFLPHLVIADKSGHRGTVYQALGPKLKQSFVDGVQGNIPMLEDMRDGKGE